VPSPDTFFLDIQDAAVSILDDDAAFDGVPILSERLGDLNNAVEIVMNKIGICVVIALYLLLHTTPRDDAGDAVATQFYADNPTIIDLRNAIDQEKFPNIQGMQLKLKCTSGFDYVPQGTLLDGNNQQLLDSMGIKMTTDRPFART